MKLKRTCLLSDDPSTEDEFGSHSRISDLIASEIIDANEGRSIAVVGEWGSGKSTVVKLLEKSLAKLSKKNIDARVFIYDAWSHQGDPLRRSFLDDFINFLSAPRFITPDQEKAAREKVWNRVEITTSTSQPLLRRHAKWLLFSAVLFSLGLKFLDLSTDEKTSLWQALSAPRNAIAVLLLLVPAFLITVFAWVNKNTSESIRKSLFGDGYDDENFSVLSFFFQKVQGSTERKLIKSPADSIVEFKQVFNDLLDHACGNNPDLRLVIIIDNIDRVPPDHAREFWSTMQTFFGADGGLRRPQTMKYWLIAPFSVNALSFVFRDSAVADTSSGTKDATAKTKDYINKTFGTALYVPPPILGNWRKYLREQLVKAFPEGDAESLSAVRELFGLGKSTQAGITPRELKLFVNALVILYRQRGEEITLPVMASYLLHREKILSEGIVNNLLSAQENRLIDAANWQVLFAALYYGVKPEEAAQLILQEPLHEALRIGESAKLRSLEAQAGFFDILPTVIRAELSDSKTTTAAKLARIAAALDALDAAAKQELTGLWREMRIQVRTISGWEGFEVSPADGLKAILAHTPSSERELVGQAIAKSLSAAEMPDPKGNGSAPDISAKNWLNAALATIDGVGAQQSISISIPVSVKFRLEVLQQVAELEGLETAKAAIKWTGSADELGNTLVGELSEGKILRAPQKFVLIVVEGLKLTLPWDNIVKAASTRLSTADVGSPEIRSLIGLLISAITTGNYENAANTFKDLSMKGVLSNLLHERRKEHDTQAAIIVATLLGNPKFERPTQVGKSASGDSVYKTLLDASNFDQDLIGAIATFVTSVAAGDRVFQVGIQNANVTRLAAAVTGRLIKLDFQFDIEPRLLIDNRDFLEKYPDLITGRDFIPHLKRNAELLKLMSSQPFDISLCRIYTAALEVAKKISEENYFVFIEQGIQTLPKAVWEKALNSTSGPHFDLVELCYGLQKGERSLELSTSTRDAILDQIRKSARGEIKPSTEIRDRLTAVFNLTQKNLQASLVSDVADDMMGVTDPLTIRRTIDVFGDHISIEAHSHEDMNRVIRRIFNPILSEPDEKTATWMLRIAKGLSDLTKNVGSETREEFESRLRTAIANASLPESVTQPLRDLAKLVQIDLSAPDDAAQSIEAKSTKPA